MLNLWENLHTNFLTKGVIKIDNYIYLSEKDKKITSVGFSKKEIKNHKGISGLKYYHIISKEACTNIWANCSHTQ